MSNLDDYNVKLETIKAIPDNSVLYPSNIPVEVYMQEAEDLFHWATPDTEKLLQAGLPEYFLNDLPIRTGACREAHSLWKNKRDSKDDQSARWDIESHKAHELHSDLIRAFNRAFRKRSDLLNSVSKIPDGNKQANLIQELNDLAVLGNANRELLQTIHFDMELLEQSSTMADELANLLAMVHSSKSGKKEAFLIRNKAFTHLKEAVDEVQDAGKYAFCKDENRLKGYRSAYLSKMYKKRKKENALEAEQPDNE